MKLTLVRHTAPENVDGLCYGQTDVALDESLFPEQAARAAADLPKGVDKVYTSPLSRCARLAEYLSSGRSLPLCSDARLMEMNFGLWENKRWDELPRAQVDAWMKDLTHRAPPEGETLHQVMQRLKAFLEDLKEDSSTRHTVIVTHGGIVKSLLTMAEQDSSALRRPILHGSVHTITLT